MYIGGYSMKHLNSYAFRGRGQNTFWAQHIDFASKQPYIGALPNSIKTHVEIDIEIHMQ